jgi:dTMP kinase
MVRGCFISFEGGEGCGKSTQIEHLARVLSSRGIEVVTTREPGGTAVAEAVRRILFDQDLGLGRDLDGLGEIFLLEAARHDHVIRLIRPALERGATVLCDRFADSSLVYQGMVRGLGEETVIELNRMATGGLDPDLTLVLDIDPGLGLERVRGRVADDRRAWNQIDEEPIEFHQRVRDGYLRLAELFPERVRIIDAAGDPDQVLRRVVEVLPRQLSMRTVS